MVDRIKAMAADAINGIDKFPVGESRVNDERERRSFKKIADGLSRFFDTFPTEVLPEDRLVGRMRFSNCEYPTNYYVRVGYKHYNKYWGACCAKNPNPLFYWGWTHIVLDFDFILKNGLQGYIRLIENHENQAVENAEFYQAMKQVLLSIGRFYERYAKVCSELHTDEGNKMAEICRKVPMYPAETFREAVQAVWSTFLLCPDSLGRIDQYLYPYYKKDIQSGLLTKESAAELLEELFVKVFETQMNNTSLPISGHNHLVVGGYKEDGTDGFNELSKLVLDCIAELPTFRPQASFRYTKHTTPETMKYITELNARCQWIVFVNDEPRIPGMVNHGIDYRDAVNYTVVGCNEWCLPSGAKIDLAHVNLMHPLEQLIYNDKRFVAAESFEEVFLLFKEHLKNDILAITEEYDNYTNSVSRDLDVLTSSLSESCIKSGRSFTQNGTKYYGLTMSFNGISNVADSLSVIKQFVFDEKHFTMHELLKILLNNYNGYEQVRERILKQGRFFGNDDDYVDDIAKAVVDAICDIKSGIGSENMNILLAGSFGGATHPNIVFGKMTRATPDGRRDGDAFTLGISQSEGKDKNGLTALLKSIAKLDYEKFCGCIVSNLKMDRSMADNDEKLTKLSQMYHAFLEMGGMQLQINYLSQEELLEAQRQPEKYRNLIVRVTGYSGYFTKFDKDLQDDIIRRTIKETG